MDPDVNLVYPDAGILDRPHKKGVKKIRGAGVKKRNNVTAARLFD